MHARGAIIDSTLAKEDMMPMKPSKMMIFFVLMPLVLLAADMQPLDQTTWSILAGAFLSGVLLTFTPLCTADDTDHLQYHRGAGGGDHQNQSSDPLTLLCAGHSGHLRSHGCACRCDGRTTAGLFPNVWVIGAMSLIFVAMALSMFGLYTIQLPAFIQSRINASSQGIPGGNVLMVFLLGAISALILGACVSPILISFLSVAIATSDPLLGALTMFFLALGMGVPLVVVGLGAGHLLPKAGGWMDLVKYFFGTVLLGVAIWIFSTLGLVPELLLWGVYLVIVAIYLNATQPLPETANGWYKLAKGIGTVLLIWGIMMLIGATYNQSDPFHPLPKPSIVTAVSGGERVDKAGIPFELVGSLEELETKRKQAVKEKKLMIVFFYTDWCPVCKKLKATTLIDPRVRQMLKKNFIAVKVNMTDLNDRKSQEIRKKFHIYGPPSFVFF